MSPRETLYNNICYNVFLLNLWSAAITQLLIQAFKRIIAEAGAESAWNVIFFDNINTFRFHNQMYTYSVFIYMTLGVSLLYFIYTIIYPDDVKFVLKKNENYMKSLTNRRNQFIKAEEPLIEN